MRIAEITKRIADVKQDVLLNLNPVRTHVAKFVNDYYMIVDFVSTGKIGFSAPFIKQACKYMLRKNFVWVDSETLEFQIKIDKYDYEIN